MANKKIVAPESPDQIRVRRSITRRERIEQVLDKAHRINDGEAGVQFTVNEVQRILAILVIDKLEK